MGKDVLDGEGRGGGRGEGLGESRARGSHPWFVRCCGASAVPTSVPKGVAPGWGEETQSWG